MEVKRELEDPFIDEYKIDIDENSILSETITECWNHEKPNSKLSTTVKNEFVSIKQENETDLRINNFQQTAIEVKRENEQIFDDVDVDCNSVQLSGFKQTKSGLSTYGKSIKKMNRRGGIFLCVVCGYMCTKKVELLSHFSINHFCNRKNSFRTKIKRKEENVIKSQVTYRGISIDADVKEEIEIVDHELKEELDEIGEYANSFQNIDDSKLCSNEMVRSDSKCYCSNTKNNPVKCKICLKDSQQRQSRDRFCQIDRKSWKSECCFNEHLSIQTNEKPFKCNFCTKSFSYKQNLKCHLRTHTGEKLFECNVCAKAFSREAHFNTHCRTHTGKKPFKCNVCTKTYSQKGGLNIHLRTHTGEKPFKCNVCTKAFSRKSHLNSHFHSHTGEKPFECNVCTKGFSQKWTLKNHMRTHTGEKPFKCNICTKSFSLKSNLKNHLRTHTGEKPFNCNVCTKSFSQRTHLNRHSLTH